ncbi:MAG: LysR family transcriptional regulator [Ruminococcus sp.]|jgi:DNA-binding transcriptional LysR family regulator
MDIKNLITFIHVAELNSFTKAGEVLGFSQSTVSFQIKQLETELNAQLFERINHTVLLTEKGREVLNYAHQINKLTQELKDNIQNRKNIAGHARIAMADSLCGLMLQEFTGFREEYPGIMLNIITAGTEEMFRLLNHNEADLILTLDNHIYNAEYVIAEEEKVGLHFVAGPLCPLVGQPSVSVFQLLSQPFILTEKRMSYRRLLDEKLAEMSLEIQPVLEIGRTDLICSLVEQNIGVAFLPDYETDRRVKEGKLFRLPVNSFEIEVWKQLLYHRDKWVSPQMESLLQYCKRTLFDRA